MNKGMFTSKKDDWRTPNSLYERLDVIYNFKLDAAASNENHKAPIWFTKDQNALLQDWNVGGSVFCNPPYGKGIGRWVEKAYLEALKGITIVLLIPARTETRWFQDYILKPAREGAAKILFVRGRIKFEDENGTARYNAPFPSAIVVYNT